MYHARLVGLRVAQKRTDKLEYTISEWKVLSDLRGDGQHKEGETVVVSYWEPRNEDGRPFYEAEQSSLVAACFGMSLGEFEGVVESEDSLKGEAKAEAAAMFDLADDLLGKDNQALIEENDFEVVLIGTRNNFTRKDGTEGSSIKARVEPYEGEE